jgi:hypothetical protein
MNPLSIPRGDRASVKKLGAVVKVDQFLPKSLSRHPKTSCRVAHDGRNVYLRFDVRDRWVQCQNRRLHGPVWRDSCVEFFFRPKANKGYFNVEINCGGQMLMFYITDWSRRPDKKLSRYTPLTKEQCAKVAIKTSLNSPIATASSKPVNWWVEAAIPLEILEQYVGKLGDLGGQTWRANFQKCGGDPKHMHWATWNPIGEKANFHQPDKFGVIVFA